MGRDRWVRLSRNGGAIRVNSSTARRDLRRAGRAGDEQPTQNKDGKGVTNSHAGTVKECRWSFHARFAGTTKYKQPVRREPL